MITLLGLPRITISVVAIHKLLPNVMNLPFISGFISSAINTAAAEYVAPKSLTLDLQRLISGDDIKKDTDAIGVIVVHIHGARGVKKADATGSSGTCSSLLHEVVESNSCMVSRSIPDVDILQVGQTIVLYEDYQGRR